MKSLRSLGERCYSEHRDLTRDLYEESTRDLQGILQGITCKISMMPRAHAQEYRMQYVGLKTTKMYFSQISFHKVLNRFNS